jgi:ubiquinone/menaquinone biosynthesis C-methylase UbiE
MKTRNPSTRLHLSIPSNANVLDVGSGHNPHPRANVLTDKFADDNYHRCGDVKVLKHQKFVEASGEALPFQDKEFDYVICSHVAEHVDDPAIFLNEISRVGKAGYLETPSLLGEYLAPKKSHQWVVLEISNKLVFVSKSRLGLQVSHDFGELFLEYLPQSSLGFKILQRTHPQLMTVNYEWKDSIEYVVEPSDIVLRQYFSKPWSRKMFEDIIPKRSLGGEIAASVAAVFDIIKCVFKSRVLDRLRSTH